MTLTAGYITPAQTTDPNNREWQDKAKTLLADLRKAIPETREGNELYYRVVTSWNCSMSWKRIFEILEDQCKNIIQHSQPAVITSKG